DLLGNIRTNADSTVFNRDNHMTGTFSATRDQYLLAVGYFPQGIDGVYGQIKNDLLQLHPVSLYLRQISGRLSPYSDSIPSRLFASKIRCVSNDIIQVQPV